jgi:threonine/homoserine/homoserine lactone efflux protein
MIGSFAAFAGVSVLVIVTPGPDTAVTISGVLGGGRRGGLFTALGVFCGQAVWTLAASAGIAALLVASEPAFLAVKYAGAAYLGFLGLQAIRAAARHQPGPARLTKVPRLGWSGRGPGRRPGARPSRSGWAAVWRS